MHVAMLVKSNKTQNQQQVSMHLDVYDEHYQKKSNNMWDHSEQP